MFTGLVQDLGKIARAERSADGARMTIETELAGELHEGDSVAVNGVCLTATESPAARSPASRERTLRRTPSAVWSTRCTVPRS